MLAHSGDFWNRNWLLVQLTIFWEVAVGALRFRRDFSHFLPRGPGPTDPAGTTLPPMLSAV